MNKNVLLWIIVINSLLFQINGNIQLALIFNVQHSCIDQEQIINKEWMVNMYSENLVVLVQEIVNKTSNYVMFKKHIMKLMLLDSISQDTLNLLLHSNAFMMTAVHKVDTIFSKVILILVQHHISVVSLELFLSHTG